ncbi:unnamed protein product, partial [Mesorhabditis spiculigera]
MEELAGITICKIIIINMGCSNNIHNNSNKYPSQHHRLQKVPPTRQEVYREMDYGSEPSPRSTDQRTTPMGISLSHEEQLLLLYLKQNADMVAALGILIPDQIRAVLDVIPWRRVELRGYEDEAPHSYTPQGMSPSRLPSQNPSGRYVKNVSSQSNVPRFVKRLDGQKGRQYPDQENGDTSRGGEGRIASEIREHREREEEFRRSRTELGLPTLEQSIDAWRRGHRGIPLEHQMRGGGGLRGARSYDKLHQVGDPLQKTVSVDHLHRDDDYDYVQQPRHAISRQE